MVLRPILDSELPLTSDFVHPWIAIERQQTAPAHSWWLIAQPDHAALSGDIAAHLSRDTFPLLDPQIVSAIAMHDAGWNLFEHDEHSTPRVHPDGRPVAFFEIAPQSFLRAWTASIDRVQEDSAMGAYMVSQHFAWLGRYRLERAADPPDVKALISDFLREEEVRQTELLKDSTGRAGCDALLPVLQFCDLLSLYLCSGTRQPVEFPHEFPFGRIRAQVQDDACLLSPNPFRGAWTASYRATRYPPETAQSICTLSAPLK